MKPLRALRHLWRRSLQVRIVSTTLLSSLIVIGLLGWLLVAQVTSGLLDSRRQSALSEARAGLLEAESIVTVTQSVRESQPIDVIVSSLAERAGTPALFDVLLLTAPQELAVQGPQRGTNQVAVSSVPEEMRAEIATEPGQYWMYHPIRYLDGRESPGLLVGAPLDVPTLGPYQLYYLFPLEQEVATIDLVKQSVLGVGALLALGIAAVAALVTRQVVTPVREAATVARELSYGELNRRMTVSGEDDLAVLAHSFNEMAENLQQQIVQLEQLSQVQQRFVSDVSHELRTPLTTVRMAAELLSEREEELSPSGRRAAELLLNQLDRFEALLADLLEISRYDAGAAALDVEEHDVVALTQQAIAWASPFAHDSTPIRLKTAQPHIFAQVDGPRMSRVLRNLVANAVEHGQGHPIDIEIRADSATVAVTVRDYGIGMTQEQSAHVFDRFWRADPSRARTLGGTGLGLAIALEDVSLHHGWLHVWSQPQQGAQFRVTLPRKAGQTLQRSPLPLSPDTGYVPNTQGAS